MWGVDRKPDGRDVLAGAGSGGYIDLLQMRGTDGVYHSPASAGRGGGHYQYIQYTAYSTQYTVICLPRIGFTVQRWGIPSDVADDTYYHLTRKEKQLTYRRDVLTIELSFFPLMHIQSVQHPVPFLMFLL